MFRDAKLFRETTDGIENLPSCPNEHRPPNPPSSGLSRDPLHAIPDPTQTWTPGVDKDASHNIRVETTPMKPRGMAADALPHFRTPEKQGNGTFGKNRFGWSAIESRNEMATCVGLSSRNGGSLNMTPRTTRATTVGRPGSHTETTPTKSVSKPPNAGFAPLSSSRVPGSYSRNGNYAALSRGVPACSGQPMVINTVEVPHFDLKEDPSFWIHHNVQVIIRVRPLSSPERGQQGYNRCVKQESSQNISWIGQPETRFTFDHVACETVDQEMLFRKAGLPMVENCLSGYNSCMFAYGQTGSGKTYTMLGDLDDLEFKPSPHRGMTPRIFEYLFARIRAEEESRRDDQLKYSCKCSFLEIYNEQITDLLNPSSTNLLLREDTRKGIYVENLSEFEVFSVGDILNLLAQGSLNRKVAATNMNMESSRSHSVFTCVIESKWDRDSTTNLRFARLNLVDLAGSERQKTSGAEGERLKEAANINKSLSTLGHVIMVLVDVANGKIRHVPYRDSKLTFLLQDSLGGNSKTIIIANISPSTGCAAETLNTLKFAQRAKLIQNNAIVNEDSSGDVSALQHQIRLLKEELSALKRQPVSRSLSFGPISLQYNTEDNEDVDMEIDQPVSDNFAQFETEAMRMYSEQLKLLEKMVAGALRREQMAETSIKKLEAEIEHLNRLVHQREEDARCSKMKLKFREDKIRRMESLLKGAQPVDSYLLEENDALSEEIRMLQEKFDRNPEVTRFALENIRLLEQVKRFQDFYEDGEREILLSEVSELRDKLIQRLDENNKQDLHSNIPIAPKESAKSCQENDSEPTVEALMTLELELDILKIILKEERSSRAKADELATCLSRELKLAKEGILSTSKQCEDVNEQLKEAKLIIEALKSQQLFSITELEDLKNKNGQYVELMRKQELELVAFKQRTCYPKSNDCSVLKEGTREGTLFQFRIEKMKASLEKAKMLNASYQRDHAFQRANEEEISETHQQVEEETAQVILCLQDELSALQQQLQDSCWKEKEVESRLALLETTLSEQQDACNVLSCENETLRQQMKEKEKDVELLSKEWDLIISEIEGALTDGHEALIDASEQLDSICSYVPMKGRWISEQVHRLIKQASEKELVIEDLNSCLENANTRLNDMECMLRSLKGAAMVITESHQKECSGKEKEIHRLRYELSATSKSNLDMESEISLACDELRKASKCATVAFVIVNRLLELNSGHLDALKHNELRLKESVESNHMKDGLLDKCAAASKETERQIQSLRKEIELTEESCNWLGYELAKQQVYISVMERQLEEYHELDMLKTKEKLSELQVGVSTMKSCMNTYELVDGSTDAWRENAEGRKEYHVYNSVGCPADDESGSTFEACSDTSIHVEVKQNEMSTKTCKGEISKNATVGLLRKEIESALESLKDVQAEVIRLNAEKQELSMSERQSREGMGMVKTQVLHIQAAFGDFEDQCLHKMKALNQKLEQVEQHVDEATCSWSQAKETFEDELSNATVDVAKKTAEASCLFSKYEEAQDVMKEADDMIKGLMISNETMKLEIKDLREQNKKLVQELEAFNILKGKLLSDIKRSFDCVTRKENEAEEFSAKLRTYESKIIDLQRQEELMLERSNYLGFQLANLVKDLDHSNSDTLASLLEKEKLLNDSKKATASQEEYLMMELSEKDFELVIMTSELQQLADEKAEMEEESAPLKNQLRILQLSKFEDLSWTSSRAAKCLHLTEAAEMESHRMFAMLNEKIEIVSGRLSQDNCENLEMVTKIEEMLEPLETIVADIISENSALQVELLRKDEALNGLVFDLSLLQESASSNRDQKDEIQKLTASLNFMEDELKTRSQELDDAVAHVYELEALMKEKTDKMSLLERELSTATNDVELLAKEKVGLASHVDEILGAKVSLERELNEKKKLIESLEIGIVDMQNSVDQANASIESLKSELEEVSSDRDHLQQELRDLEEKLDTAQDSTHGLESKISFLEQDLELRKADLEELRYSLSSTNEESCLKSQELQNHVMTMNTMEEESAVLKKQLRILQLSKFEDLSLTSSSAAKCLNLTESAEMESHRMFALLNKKIEIVSGRLSQDNCENLEAVVKIEEMLEPLETIVVDILSENSALQVELLRKDEVLNGLLFDLSLLQESASSNKDQKDEIQNLTTSLNFKKDELKTRSQELDDAVAHVYELEALMKEKTDKMSLLERELSTATNAVQLLAKEKADLASHVDGILAAKLSLERELNEKKKLVESLEIGLVDMQNSVDQTNASIESLKSELEKVSSDRDHLQQEQLDLEEKLDTAQALAEEYEAIAMEAKQIAESNRIYGEEKEEEVKLLERSVQELDRTVDAMENKVDILKEEAQRQRLQREELEMELESLKHQMHNLKSADSDIKRHLEEKEKNLQKALKHVQKLEKDLDSKDSEISHCKAHITELNLHAEAQASEYQKKFKALEAMFGQVKTEGQSCSSNKLEKNATKSRGSGSPFKCIGIGLAQQLKLDKDEDLTAERFRIQELEALAANRQKEIFVLNNRLAAAESMTHDVIRDLLGVKQDMTNYVSMLDKQQVQKIAVNAQDDKVDSEVKVEDINKLKKLLNEFVEERKGWLDEIDRRRAELLAAQLAHEKLHQRHRSVTAENEVLKVDVQKYKNKVMELEGEVNQLSGQQNLHQRIHHHAKIKEENNILRRQNKKIFARLQEAESFLMRMKEGIPGLRGCDGKVEYIDFDEEKRLSNKLKEAEEERVQLAQELLGLCTSILKAAGIQKASSDINVASAEAALEQLRSRFTCLEREFENLKVKSRIENERIRLSEITMMQSPRSDSNCMTPPKRASQSPFFTALDR